MWVPGPGRRILRDRVWPDEGIGEREGGVENLFFYLICDCNSKKDLLISMCNKLYTKNKNIDMNMLPQSLRIFGSILIVVALITSISLFGNSDQHSFFKTPSKSLPVQTKSFTNPIIPNQFSFQPVLNRDLVQSESVPIINNSWINAHVPSSYIPGPGLPDDYDLSSLYCGPGMRCL
jgi:hypothetical protein